MPRKSWETGEEVVMWERMKATPQARGASIGITSWRPVLIRFKSGDVPDNDRRCTQKRSKTQQQQLWRIRTAP